MKKILLMITAAVAVSLIGCDSKVNYQEQGKKMAQELDRLCELKDSAAVLAMDDSIHSMEDRIAAQGDSLAINQFRNALQESRIRNAAYIATLKVASGVKKDSVVKEMNQDVLDKSIDISAVTDAIDEMNKANHE